MTQRDLPESKILIATAVEPVVIAQALERTLPGGSKNVFTHMDIIRGGDSSQRIFFVEPVDYDDVIPIDRPLSPIELANELLKLTREEARYNPRINNPMHYLKGWEIWRVEFGRTVAARAVAAWVAL